MRRAGLLIAGMFLVTGAGLAVANPAAAAPNAGADRPRGYHCHWYNGHGHWNDWYDWDDGDDWDGPWHNGDSRRRYCHRHRGMGHGHGHGLISVGVGVHIGIGGHN